jgi:hypothetical protein
VPGDPAEVPQGAELEEQTGYVARALRLLIEQFQRKPKIQSFVRSWVSQAQELERALFQLLLERAIATAVGQQLDGLGDILGELRGGRDDPTYRVFLQARTIINNSDGKHEDVLSLLRLILTPIGGSAPPLQLIDFFPAAFEAGSVVDPIPIDPQLAADMLQLVRGAGIGAIFVFVEQAGSLTFQFASGATVETDDDQGYADVPLTVGGAYAGAAA